MLMRSFWFGSLAQTPAITPSKGAFLAVGRADFFKRSVTASPNTSSSIDLDFKMARKALLVSVMAECFRFGFRDSERVLSRATENAPRRLTRHLIQAYACLERSCMMELHHSTRTK